MTTIKFGTDGWRGRIAEDYTFDSLRRCAQGFATYLQQKGLAQKGVVIGHDQRFHAENFAAAAAEVLANAESHLARTLGDVAGLGPMEVDALAHRSDPPVLREQKTFDGRPQMVLAKDPTAPTGWRPARKAEIASGVYEEAAP